MSETFDLSSMKKSDLGAMCKARNLKNYSKLKKDDMIAMLVEAGVKNVPAEKSKSGTKKGSAATSNAKPRFVNLATKLEKFVDLEKYRATIANYTEETSDEEILELLKDDITEFISSDDVEAEDYAKYIDKYGGVKAAYEYAVANPKSKIEKLTLEEYYKKLAVFVYGTDSDVTKNLIKKVRKLVVSINKEKEKKEAATKKPATKKSSKKSKDESDDEKKASDDEEEEEEEEEEEDDE